MLLSHTTSSHLLAACKACLKGRGIWELEKKLLRKQSVSTLLVVRGLQQFYYYRELEVCGASVKYLVVSSPVEPIN